MMSDGRLKDYLKDKRGYFKDDIKNFKKIEPRGSSQQKVRWEMQKVDPRVATLDHRSLL